MRPDRGIGRRSSVPSIGFSAICCPPLACGRTPLEGYRLWRPVNNGAFVPSAERLLAPDDADLPRARLRSLQRARRSATPGGFVFGRRKRQEEAAAEAAREAERRALFAKLAERPGAHLPVPRPGRRPGRLRRGSQRRPSLLRVRRPGAALGRAADAGLPGARLRQLPALPPRRARHPDRGAGGAAPATGRGPAPAAPAARPAASSRAPSTAATRRSSCSRSCSCSHRRRAAGYLYFGGALGLVAQGSATPSPTAEPTSGATPRREREPLPGSGLASPTPEPTPSAGDTFAFYEVSVGPRTTCCSPLTTTASLPIRAMSRSAASPMPVPAGSAPTATSTGRRPRATSRAGPTSGRIRAISVSAPSS